MTEIPLLEIDDVAVEYDTKGLRRSSVRVLDGVSLDIRRGETLGLVGESGSGKTTLGRAVLGLAPVTGGAIRFEGRTISGLGKKERRALSSDIQVVFQDPYASLNPAMTIGDILAEPLAASGVAKEEARRRVKDLLDSVHLPADAAQRLPREFSGGQRQRVAIARALCRGPKLIVCDEPVSALDLSTQACVLVHGARLPEGTGLHELGLTEAERHTRGLRSEGHALVLGGAQEGVELGVLTGRVTPLHAG